MKDMYTQTIELLNSSLNLDYELDRKILDIIPKLIEARSRYWTKGEHGYFTGSYSDGKSGGTPNCSGGMGVISSKSGKGSATSNKTATNTYSGVDVTDLYEQIKAPNSGSVTYDEGYNEKIHKAEINFANWLHSYYGGDIHLLSESTVDGTHMPDYIWNGKMWDLKSATTEKSANGLIRKGLKQIQQNPGGIFLNYGSNKISLDVLTDYINKRMQWCNDIKADIIVIEDGTVTKVIRYKK